MRRFFLGLAIAVSAAVSPSLGRADDLQTAQQIADNLRTSGTLKGFSIGVQYREGKATLRGSVTSEQQRTMAMAIAQSSDGVSQVADELTVIGAASAPAAGVPAKAASAGKGFVKTKASGNAAQAQPIPRGFAPAQGVPAAYNAGVGGPPAAMAAHGGAPIPAYIPGMGGGVAPAKYDQAHMPNYAWPAYAAYPNYGAVTYPKQYSPTAWPFIGPFYPYPQVPLGWRKVTLEWDDGWWMLDFKARRR
jgi:hypothetical protein